MTHSDKCKYYTELHFNRLSLRKFEKIVDNCWSKLINNLFLERELVYIDNELGLWLDNYTLISKYPKDIAKDYVETLRVRRKLNQPTQLLNKIYIEVLKSEVTKWLQEKHKSKINNLKKYLNKYYYATNK